VGTFSQVITSDLLWWYRSFDLPRYQCYMYFVHFDLFASPVWLCYDYFEWFITVLHCIYVFSI